MADRFPLQTVLDLMQERADEAARELGRRIASEQDAAVRLRLLEGYRDEYATRFRDAAERGLTPGQWANYQEFSNRIELAIAQQSSVVDVARSHISAGQALWQQQNHKAQAIDTLAQKHATDQRTQEGRRDQKLTDEVASRLHRDKEPPV